MTQINKQLKKSGMHEYDTSIGYDAYLIRQFVLS